MDNLYPSFIAGLAPEAASRFDKDRDAVVLDTHWTAAREAWPDVDVDAARYGAELARRLGPEATSETLARIRAADVYVAIACADGDDAAIGSFDRLLIREVESAAVKCGASRDQGIEVAGDLRRILFVDEGARPAAIREFSGRGDLRSYIRVMATRALIRVVNKGRREVGVDDDVIDRLVPHTDPELSFLRAQYHDAVDAAMRAALVTLDDRSRALLRYQLIDGWSIDQVGKLYGVHRATAARWISGARELLGQRIRAELASRLEIDVAEVDSIVRLVQSRVEVSLDRQLGPLDPIVESR